MKQFNQVLVSMYSTHYIFKGPLLHTKKFPNQSESACYSTVPTQMTSFQVE